MMTSRTFALLLLAINLTIILAVGGVNFIIDGDSSRHLPMDRSVIPRTTNHSALSKLHYIYRQQPEVMYFGSSRVEVGLPVERALFPHRTVYNAALSANTLGNTLPLIQHVLGGYTPKVIVLGVDFMSFMAKPSPESNLDMGLLSANFQQYQLKRAIYDVKRAVTVEASQHSLTSLRALLAGRPYDPIAGPASVDGHTSDNEMLRLTATRGQYLQAFQRTLKYAASAPPPPAEVRAGLALFDQFLGSACARGITLRVFTNPRHALAEYMLARNGHWPAVERWKVALTGILARYPGCDVKLLDFSGFNSVTSESVAGLTPAAGLANYWEASHFKENVGRLILQRLFVPDAAVPADFGYELNTATVAALNAQSRAARARYEAVHGDELAQAVAWLKVDTSH